jgi:anti-sigma B factor antagonist
MDGNNALELVPVLDKAVAAGRTELYLDLSGVEYMNSSGLRELVRLSERIRRRGAALHVINPSDRVRAILELVGLDSIFNFDDDTLLDLSDLPNGKLPALNRQVHYLA